MFFNQFLSLLCLKISYSQTIIDLGKTLKVYELDITLALFFDFYMKKILVHDDKNYVFRLIKFNLKSSDYEVIKSTKKYFGEFKIDSFDVVFYAFYNEFDILYFLDYYNKNKDIVILYEDFKIIEKIHQVKPTINLINLNLMKTEIILLIKESLYLK